MPTLQLMRGDANYYIEFEVRDQEGDIVDVTGCSIGFKMQRYGESTLTISKQGSVLNGTLGLCQVLIASELANKAGEFFAELEIRWQSNKKLTAPNIYIKVLKDLPR